MWNQWQNSVLGNIWSDYITDFVKHASLCTIGNNFLHMGLLPNTAKFFPQKYKFSIQNNYPSVKISGGIVLNTHYYTLPFENESMDCILSIHSFDQLEQHEIQPSIQEINRVLKPHGKLIIVNFNPYGLWYMRHRAGKLFKHAFLPLKPKHSGISYYNFQDLLSETGIRLQQAQFGIYDLPSNSKNYKSINENLNKMGNRWWPNLSNIYSLIMIKHVQGMYLNTEKEITKESYPYTLNIQPTPKKALYNNHT